MEGEASAIRSEKAERERKISEIESLEDSVHQVYTADSRVWKNVLLLSVTVDSSLQYSRKNMNLESTRT